jgi:hypothetical protein
MIITQSGVLVHRHILTCSANCYRKAGPEGVKYRVVFATKVAPWKGAPTLGLQGTSVEAASRLSSDFQAGILRMALPQLCIAAYVPF